MPQVASSLEGVTPRQAIATAVRIRGLKSEQAQRAVQETLDTLDLGDWSDRPGHKLSGGIKRLTVIRYGGHRARSHLSLRRAHERC